MNIGRLAAFLAFAVSIIFGFPGSAQAQVPGGGGLAVCQQVVSNVVVAQSGGTFPAGPGSCSLGTTASASVAVQPSVLLSARVDASQVPVGNGSAASANVALQYDFTVTGGQVGGLVPIRVHTQMAALVSPSMDANNANIASVSLNLFGVTGPGGTTTGNGPSVSACMFSPDNSGCTSSFSGDLLLNMASGSSQRVFLQILIAASSNFAGTASAWIDPYIYVDPAFANAADYTITLTSGVANALPVPEPAMWMQCLAGMIVLAATAHRRRPGAAQKRFAPSLFT